MHCLTHRYSLEVDHFCSKMLCNRLTWLLQQILADIKYMYCTYIHIQCIYIVHVHAHACIYMYLGNTYTQVQCTCTHVQTSLTLNVAKITLCTFSLLVALNTSHSTAARGYLHIIVYTCTYMYMYIVHV